jgi:hypothetical protein
MPSAHSSICSLGPAKLTNPSWEDRQTNMSLPPGLGGGTVAPVWEKNVLYPHTELLRSRTCARESLPGAPGFGGRNDAERRQ